MTTCFCTYVSDHLYEKYGTDKLIKSAKYFYPEIPFMVKGDEWINNTAKYNVPVESMQPFLIQEMLLDYKGVVYFDADSMITGRMDELFRLLDFPGIVCVRNNNDFGKSGIDDPLLVEGRPVTAYYNAGLVASSNEKFADEWCLLTTHFAKMLPFGSQTVLNGLVSWHIISVVDGIEEPEYYGVSALSGTTSHWDSWKQITVENSELILNGKKVKVLHHAGGALPEKLNFDLFSEEVRKRLEEITT